MSGPRTLLRAATIAAMIATTALAPAAAQATTTGHTGSGRPALALSGGRLWIGWTGTTGTAAAKGLNLGWSVDDGTTITKTADGEYAPQGEGPALDGDGTGVYMAWPSGKASNQLTAIYSTGGAFLCRTAFAGITTPHSPALTSDTAGHRWIAWDDPSGHLNVAQLNSSACATGGPMTLVNRVTLPVTSPYGPEMAFDSNPSSNLGVLLTWLDAAHHIQVGSFDGTTTLKNQHSEDGPVAAAATPAASEQDTDIYLTYVGTDHQLYLGYSEGCRPACFQYQPTGVTNASFDGSGMVDDNVFRYAYFDTSGHLNVTVWL